jgi:4-aminobutyrate aminotransferase/(S)-3-amino-2-methylpropionate transaminase
MINVGHSPETVVNAMKAQMDKFIHTCQIVTTFEPSIRLAEMLNALTPGDFPKKTLFSNSGSEAVENAVNLAKYYTGRPGVMVFEGAYHGRTMLTMSLTSKYNLFKKGYGAMVSDIYRMHAPNFYRMPEGMTEAQYLRHCIERLEEALISHIDPSALAAILIEPVLGEGGFIPIHSDFLRRLRSIADQHGIVLIFDEIQCGMGRTGKLFASEYSGVVPDLMTIAKSLGAGMPIAAVTGRAEIMDKPHLGAVGGLLVRLVGWGERPGARGAAPGVRAAGWPGDGSAAGADRGGTRGATAAAALPWDRADVGGAERPLGGAGHNLRAADCGGGGGDPAGLSRHSKAPRFSM